MFLRANGGREANLRFKPVLGATRQKGEEGVFPRTSRERILVNLIATIQYRPLKFTTPL